MRYINVFGRRLGIYSKGEWPYKRVIATVVAFIAIGLGIHAILVSHGVLPNPLLLLGG